MSLNNIEENKSILSENPRDLKNIMNGIKGFAI